MKRRFLFLLVLVGIVLCTSGCAVFEAVGNAIISRGSGNSGSSGGSTPVGDTGGGAQDPLVGKWTLWGGEYIYFFETSSQVEFMHNGTVVERDGDNRGTWTSQGGKNLTVEEGSYTHEFTYTLEDGVLMLSDEDGDDSIYLKDGSRATPGNNGDLVGRWEFWSGDYIYFFGVSDLIEFGSTGTVSESGEDNRGVWTTVGSRYLRVVDSNYNYLYTYEVKSDVLYLTDEDGDKAAFQKTR